MRVFLIRFIALLVIFWAAFQPGAALNPNPAPAATSTPDNAQPTAATPAPSSANSLPSPSPTPAESRKPITAGLSAVATSPVDSSETIRFAVIGDYGSGGKHEEAVAKMVKGWDPDFIITTGDNNYSSGARVTIDRNIGKYYQEFIYPYDGEFGEGAETNRFFPTLGNHDWTTSKAKAYLDYFTLPGNERYYDFIWGAVHFFALDSDPRDPDGVGISSLQATWLREALAASHSQWKIVYMHRPPYSSSDVHGSAIALQWPYAEWGADAVISGHDHTYERVLLDGFPYFVNGLGGMSRYAFGEPVPGSKFRYQKNFGAMRVKANEEMIRFEFFALEDKGSRLIDSYSITR